MDEQQEMSLAAILTNYADGDGIGWSAEFAYLRTFHADRIADVTASVAREGFKEPIYLGYDGRVWDGHHRLAVAEALNWKTLPVLLATEEDDQ